MGRTAWNLTASFPKRNCGTKRVSDGFSLTPLFRTLRSTHVFSEAFFYDAGTAGVSNCPCCFEALCFRRLTARRVLRAEILRISLPEKMHCSRTNKHEALILFWFVLPKTNGIILVRIPPWVFFFKYVAPKNVGRSL